VALAQDIAVLESVPLFRQLDRDALRLIAFAAEARSGQPGELLFVRGEISDAGYVVMSGSVVVEGAAGDRSIASRGTLIGEMALLIDTERPVTATVKEAGQLLKISRGVFRRVLEEYPEAADALRDLIARRMEDTLLGLGRVGDSLMGIKD
jgi:CRP-like cAMP-binding protein